MVSIADLVADEKAAWFEYKHGVKFKLTLADRHDLADWLKRSRKVEWEKHQKVESTDQDKWLTVLAGAIVDWKGLTTHNLHKFGKFKPPTNGAKPENITFNAQNAQGLMTGDLGLEKFVYDRVSDAQAFDDEQLEREKKS